MNQIARRLHEGGSIYETEVDDILERQKYLLGLLTNLRITIDSTKTIGGRL